MVPAPSHRVPRVPWYSGSCRAASGFRYGAVTLFGRSSQYRSPAFHSHFCSPYPEVLRTPVWALPLSLAATRRIDVSFFSSGYLDVSVRRVPFRLPLTGRRIHGVSPCGFPHSEIRGSLDICSSPRLFAACHVFLRLPVPGHPPCALFRLTFFFPGCIALQPLPQSFPLQVALRSVSLFLSSYFFPYRLSLLLSLTEQTLPRMSFHCFGSFSIRFSRYNVQ